MTTIALRMPTRPSPSASDAGATPFGSGLLDAEPWRRYRRRMQRVIEHLHDHLDEPLDLTALADVAHLSPHHWHRVYHAMCGETLAQTVRRMRLHRAAGELATSSTPIARVAARAGYPNLQSFTRTFKAEYGLPPARFRAEGQHRAFELHGTDAPAAALDVAVQALPALHAFGLEHRGSYMAIGRAFDLLFSRVAAAGLARPGMRMFGLFYDDPDLTPEAALRSIAAVVGCAEPDDTLGLQRVALFGARFGTLLHTGPYTTMRAAYRWLYGQWLPASGYEPTGAGVVEEYLNSPRDTPPHALKTRISLALADAAAA